METQSQIAGKLAEANNKIKGLEKELGELKSKQDVGEDNIGDDIVLTEEPGDVGSAQNDEL